MASGKRKPKAAVQETAKGELSAELSHPQPERIRRAVKLMCRHGMDRGRCTARLMAEFGIGQRTADEDWAEAKAQVTAHLKGELPELAGCVVECLKDQYEKADAEKDRRSAIAAQKLIAQISGALTERVEHSGTIRAEVQAQADRDVEQLISNLAADFTVAGG